MGARLARGVWIRTAEEFGSGLRTISQLVVRAASKLCTNCTTMFRLTFPHEFGSWEYIPIFRSCSDDNSRGYRDFQRIFISSPAEPEQIKASRCAMLALHCFAAPRLTCNMSGAEASPALQGLKKPHQLNRSIVSDTYR